jgi:hypothetical protein
MVSRHTKLLPAGRAGKYHAVRFGHGIASSPAAAMAERLTGQKQRCAATNAGHHKP